MKQTVEESVKEAIHKHYNCNGTYPCSEREYCEHCNGHNTAFDCCECGADEFKEGQMKSKQVLSIEQMKHLQELGLDTSDASMHWQYLPTADAIINGTDEIEKEPTLFVSQPNMKHEYPAYTLQDILDKLPHYLNPFPSKQILFAWMIERDTIAYRNVEV